MDRGFGYVYWAGKRGGAGEVLLNLGYFNQVILGFLIQPNQVETKSGSVK